MIKKADIALICIITLFALLFNIFFAIYEKKQPAGARVSVMVDGAERRSVSLTEDGLYTIELGGGVNTFRVEDGRAVMTAADCPDGLCLRQKGISRGGEIIVCLPHRLVLKVTGADAGSPDSLTY